MSSLLDRRNHKRLLKRFQVSIKIARTATEIDGVTENISQGGALISSQSLPSFQKNEEAIVQLFLPPETQYGPLLWDHNPFFLECI